MKNNKISTRNSSPGLRRALPLAVIVVALVIALLTVTGAFVVIETGHVGVDRTLGTIDMDERAPGLSLKLPFFTRVMETSAKEIVIDLNDLKPKAKDNLSLKDLDISVYYRVAPERAAETLVKYANGSSMEQGIVYPAYNVIVRESRRAVYETVATLESLSLHRERELISANVQTRLQGLLDSDNPDTFVITRVVVRAITTDPGIEESIKTAIANQKRLEAKQIEVDIAQKDAEIEIERARGIAEANRIIDQSLTRNYLQHEQNVALQKFAENGQNNTIVIPAGMTAANLLINPGGK